MPDSIVNTLHQLDECLVRFMNRHALAGVAVGIVQNGRTLLARSYGTADFAEKRPLTPKTVFRMASISKTLTAIAVMQLCEQGKIDLDGPVNDYLRAYKVLHRSAFASPVTVRQMLSHTSGIGEGRDLWDVFNEYVLHRSDTYFRPGEAMPTLAAYYRGVLRPEIYPGKKWAYANHAFATLGQLLEDVSGESFGDYMRAHVLDPLGLFKSDFVLTPELKTELAQGYILKRGTLKRIEFRQFPELAAGSLLSNVEDMCRYLAALMNGGSNAFGRVLAPATLDMMLSPQYQPHPSLEAMGLGFFLADLDGHRAAWHGGHLDGFNSALWVAPEDKLGVILCANTNTRALYHAAEDILRSLIGLQPYHLRLPKAGVLAVPHLWGEMCGIYDAPAGLNTSTRTYLGLGGEVKIEVKQNHLTLRSLAGLYPQGITLYPADAADPLLYEAVVEGKLVRLAFGRNSAGRIDRLFMTALTFYTLYKRPFVRSLRFKLTLLPVLAVVLGAFWAWLLRRKKK